MNKQPRAIRKLIDIISGKLSNGNNYILKKDCLLIGDEKIKFSITTNQYQALKKLGY